MISVQNIHKSFGHLKVLNDISFQVEKGECVSLLGANGAGKTTLFRILSGQCRPTKGSVFFDDQNFTKNKISLFPKIGFVGHHSFLYGDMSAEENLRFYAKMYHQQNYKTKIDELFDLVQLNHRRHDLVRTFSKGMQQRIAIARSLLHDPDILLLDEPFSGLDVKASSILKNILDMSHQQGKTILVITHDFDYAQTNTERVLFLQKGTVDLDSQTTNLTQNQLQSYFDEQH